MRALALAYILIFMSFVLIPQLKKNTAQLPRRGESIPLRKQSESYTSEKFAQS